MKSKTGRPSWRDGSGGLCHLEKRVSRATGKVGFVGVPFGVALEEETFAKALVQSQFTSWLDDRDICVNSMRHSFAEKDARRWFITALVGKCDINHDRVWCGPDHNWQEINDERRPYLGKVACYMSRLDALIAAVQASRHIARG